MGAAPSRLPNLLRDIIVPRHFRRSSSVLNFNPSSPTPAPHLVVSESCIARPGRSRTRVVRADQIFKKLALGLRAALSAPNRGVMSGLGIGRHGEARSEDLRSCCPCRFEDRRGWNGALKCRPDMGLRKYPGKAGIVGKIGGACSPWVGAYTESGVDHRVLHLRRRPYTGSS